ncbi:hypothetical protein CFP56_019023 [Quercus suber]|uniref:RNase H type-1 domain-containing protein n=1 Tax=Quercus suber TaxID=58331 RepID=A0AAW0KJN4_QUESU
MLWASLETRQTLLSRDVMGDGLTDGVGQDGVKKNGKDKPKSGYTQSIIRNQAKGKGDFKVGSPKEGTSSGPSILVAPMHWTRPPDGLYKVNFDAALFEVSGCASIGVAKRDSSGVIIGALSQKILHPHSMELAEALAAHRAVIFAQELSIANILVEGDFLKRVVREQDFTMPLNSSQESSSYVQRLWQATPPLINAISHLVVGLNGDVAITTTVKQFESSSF